ncbi:MAG: NHLP leader peptide family RiPP precursor [Paenibacillaceae bacterium]
MLYYFIQDDRMDATSPHNKIQIPLANLLQLQFLDRYSQLLASSTTSFLQLYSIYMIDWAEAAANEDHAHHFAENPLYLARKSSPLKLCSTSACLLLERESLIPIVSVAVDLVLTTIQMADDWVDWQDDLHEGNYNSLIDFIQSQSPLEDDIELNLSFVKRALYVKGILQNYVQVAVDQHEHLISLNIPIPQLISFHHSIVQYLLQEASRIDKDRDSLAQIKIIQKAWEEPIFKAALLKDPKSAIQEAFGILIPETIEIVAVEEKLNQFYLVIPANPADVLDRAAEPNARW